MSTRDLVQNETGSTRSLWRRTIRRLVIALFALGAALALAVPSAVSPAAAQSARPHVDVIEVSGLLDPVLVDFVGDALRDAEAGGAQALVIQLDSSGAVASDDDLAVLTTRIRHAAVPVTVWVGPSGARAYGGAYELVRAAAIAGAAPGTKLGDLGTPLFEGTDDPLLARRVGDGEALELGVVEVDAPTLGDFIVDLDGRQVGGRTLSTARVVGAGSDEPRREPTVEVRFGKPALLARLLHTVASPSVAYLLLLIGLLLVVFEFYTAGVGVAGATGAGSLVLAGYGLGVLPTRPSSVALLAVGVLGFSIDLQAGAPRTWTVIGTVALAAGSVRLYDGHSVPLLTLAVGVVGVALFMVAAMPAVVRSRFSTPTIGRESMIGEMGLALADVNPDGTVEVRGAPWRARTNRATPIAAGDRVRVVGIDGLLLEVEPEEGGARDAGH